MGNCMATLPVYDIARFVWVCSSLWDHLYFSSLDKAAGVSPLRQQWPIRFGTTFAYATASLLPAAIEAAYDQQLWTLSKHGFFSLNGINDLSALKSTSTGFLNAELLAHAKLAVLLAFCSR
ncbi:hypothetical protein EAE96_011061 [Botrytis aclada]|nr:hypothetical protein EAE96_011061 [Botrytis aclada]